MATGGVEDVEVDSRVICSVCLEPYRGRQAKILPCFHTFCLPCLTGLAARDSKSSATRGQDSEDETGRSAVSLTCPTCRRVIPVPAGGVTAFQTNFYLDTNNEEKGLQSVLCSLCDGDQKAQFQCNKCQNNFCSQCRRYHDKCCQGSQITVLQDPSDTSSSAQSPTNCQIKEQLKMVEDGLKKLTEEEHKLNQERRAMDDSINVRYTTLLRHAADARDACLISLREVYDGLTEQLHSHMAEARQTRDTLQQQLSPSQPAPVSASQLRAALFIQGDLQMILNRNGDSASLLKHQMKENTTLMIDTLQSFMGKIVKSSQSPGPAQSKEASESASFQDDHGTVSPMGADPKNWNDLYQKLEDMAGRVNLLQSTNTQLSQHMTLLSNTNSKLSTEQSALQREVIALKDTNVKLTSDQATLQREMAALRDKNVIVHQDLAVLTAEKDKVCADLAKLQTDVVSMQREMSSQQTDIVQLKADHGAVVSKVSNVQTDITALQGDGASMKTDVSQLKTDCGELKAHMAKVQQNMADLKVDHSTLQTDISASQSQVVSLQRRVQSAQDSMQNNRKKLTALESRFLTANTQVVFHAILPKEVTTNKVQQTLICDYIVSNVGGGYDGQTGVFTAPLAGTFCFLATTSPRKADVEKKARLDIVLDGEVKGYVFSIGDSWSTGHTVVKMTAGQRVWLRTYDDREYTFSTAWWTSFSGMLLQADV